MSRTIVWYSDGAASAVAAKMAIDRADGPVQVVKCDTTEDEHSDNIRFREDVERWIGQKVILIKSDKYANVDDVFMTTRYMAGPSGARCTTELKKLVRRQYQEPDDVHVFGYTLDEEKRIQRFEANNPELTCWWVLRDEQISKQDCYFILDQAGIALPEMYRLGYDHNNCLGCVKASSASYWARIRRDFPDAFSKRAEQSRELGARLVRWQGVRIFLDELPEEASPKGSDGNIECGPFCEMEPSLFSQNAFLEDADAEGD